MGCRNHRISDNTLKGAVSWDPTNSMGEALSTVCEALLHPNGYYGPHIQGPRIDWWLNYSSFTTDGSRLTIRRNWRRPNYVDRTDNTDRNDVSYGCGIVFIYYLMWLGYSMKGIIASGGATLEETYKNLTGRSGGWKAMTDLLNLYLPERPVWSYWPSRDNLFPLPGLTAITLSPDSVVAGDSSIGTATLDAPSDGNIITSLFSSAPRFATVASEVSISVGSTVGTFVVSTCPSSETLRQEAA